MPQGRVSRAVARLLRPFHRHHHETEKVSKIRARTSFTSNTVSTCSTSSSSRNSDLQGSTVVRGFPIKCDSEGIPITVLMPSTFFRQLRALMEQTTALTTGEQQRASQKGTESSTRTSTIRWRGDFSTKTLEKLTLILTEDETDSFATTIGRHSTKSVPLETASKAMLQLWNCCMQILDVLADGATPEPSLRHTMAHSRDLATAAANEKKRQLEQATLTLLAFVIRRQELDALLVAAGHGGCKSHKPVEDARHGMARMSRRLSRTSRHSGNISTTASAPKFRSPSRHSRKNKCACNVRLCDYVHQFLELHQTTFQYAFETVHGYLELSLKRAEFKRIDQNQELLSALVATSYLRVPRLRSHMLINLNKLLPSSVASFTSSMSSRGKDEELRLTPFNWHLTMFPHCQNLLTTVNREDRWAPSTQMLTQLMNDSDGCMLVLAQIFEQLTGQQVLGRTDWTSIPGADVLNHATQEIVKNLFHIELLQREPMWQDVVEDKAGNEMVSEKEPQPFRPSISLLDGGLDDINTPTAYFGIQLTSMMHENVSFIHSYLMTIFHSTNYMLPHHVLLCLQYLEKLMIEFPSFFLHETATMETIQSSSLQEHLCANVETLRFVFSCLLESEHFEILKATELFLLKNFMGFSVTLQLKLTDLMATHLKRLFLHWNRDVRYCYYHILLYLTYPGNRVVLGAKSDEALMGAEASHLFEIPGLMCTPGTASWDAFDIPLHQLITRYSHITKRRARDSEFGAWVDTVPCSVLQRSIIEYKSHVRTYFAYAQQISIHQRVPIPVFTVKTASLPKS